MNRIFCFLGFSPLLFAAGPPSDGTHDPRNYTAHTSLGASLFMFQSGESDKQSGDFTRMGIESAEPFLHMLGKGIIIPPLGEQMKSLSPVLINVLNPTERFLTTAAIGHTLQHFNAADLAPSAFSRLDCYRAMAPTPASDVSAFVWNRTHQFDNTNPRTLFGFVPLLTGSTSLKLLDLQPTNL